MKSHHDSRQVPLSEPDSAGPGQDRLWPGPLGGSGWRKLHPGGLAVAAAVSPNHRSAVGVSLPELAAGKTEEGQASIQGQGTLWVPKPKSPPGWVIITLQTGAQTAGVSHTHTPSGHRGEASCPSTCNADVSSYCCCQGQN